MLSSPTYTLFGELASKIMEAVSYDMILGNLKQNSPLDDESSCDDFLPFLG